MLYPYPTGHPKESYAMVDVEAPDLAAFPALAHDTVGSSSVGSIIPHMT